MDLKNTQKTFKAFETPENNLALLINLGLQVELSKLTKDAQIISEIEASDWRWDVCCDKLSELENEKLVLFVIKKSDLDYEVCQEGIRILKLEKRSPQDILFFLEELNWDRDFCLAGIPGLTDDTDLMLVMEKSNWDFEVCRAGSLNLTDKTKIPFIKEKFGLI